MRGVKSTTSAEQMDFEHSRFSILTIRLAEFSPSPFTLSEGEGINLCYYPFVEYFYIYIFSLWHLTEV